MDIIVNNKKILKIKKVKRIKTVIETKPDSSIAHSALIALSQCNGISEIKNLPKCKNIMVTISILRLLGVKIEMLKDSVIIFGKGIRGFRDPKTIINVHNSAISASVFLSILSSYKYNTFFSSHVSDMKYKLLNILQILSNCGIKFLSNILPIAIAGEYNSCFLPIKYDSKSPFASRDMTSLLFYAINIEGRSFISEPIPTRRRHTENILQSLGAKITTYKKDNILYTEVDGMQELKSPISISIPKDTSLALYSSIVVLFLYDSCIEIQNVCINITRIEVYNVLLKMGINIEMSKNFGKNDLGYIGEVGNILVKTCSNIVGIEIDMMLASRILMEDYPLVITVATLSNGVTKIKYLDFLIKHRVIETMLEMLDFFQVSFQKDFDNNELIIYGVLGTNTLKCSNKHKKVVSVNNQFIFNLQNDYRLSMCGIILSINIPSCREISFQNMNHNAYQYYRLLHKCASL